MPDPNSRLVASLAVLAIGTLVVGSLLKPTKTVAESSAPAPSQTEVRRLQRLAQRSALQSSTEYFASVATDVESEVVEFSPGGASGLHWGNGLIVTPALGHPRPAVLEIRTSGGQALPSSAISDGPQLPLAVLRVSESEDLTPVHHSDDAGPAPGDWLVAVWRHRGQTAFAPGRHTGVRARRCRELTASEITSSLELTDLMLGGGLFDLDGNLVGVILRCGDQLAALTPTSVAQGITAANSFEGQLLGLYGMVAVPPNDVEKAHLGVDEGVLVRETWEGYLAEQSGLRPGDVIVARDGEPIASPSDLAPLVSLASGQTCTLRVRRNGHDVELTVPSPPAEEDPSTDAFGLAFPRPEDPLEIAAVEPDSAAAQAGVLPGDRVVRIDSRAPPSLAVLRRTLTRKKGHPVFLELERGARHVGLLLP